MAEKPRALDRARNSSGWNRLCWLYWGCRERLQIRQGPIAVGAIPAELVADAQGRCSILSQASATAPSNPVD